MAFTTLSLGLTLTIPVNGTRNWGTTIKNTTWTKISQHGHTGSGDGNQIVTAALAANAVTTAKLAKDYGYTQVSLAPSGTTQTLDWSLGNVKMLDLSGASGTVTLTLSNPSTGSWYYVFVSQGVTFRDLVWPASVKWAQGQAPIMTQTNGAVDMIKLYYIGSVYFADWQLDFK